MTLFNIHVNSSMLKCKNSNDKILTFSSLVLLPIGIAVFYLYKKNKNNIKNKKENLKQDDKKLDLKSKNWLVHKDQKEKKCLQKEDLEKALQNFTAFQNNTKNVTKALQKIIEEDQDFKSEMTPKIFNDDQYVAEGSQAAKLAAKLELNKPNKNLITEPWLKDVYSETYKNPQDIFFHIHKNEDLETYKFKKKNNVNLDNLQLNKEEFFLTNICLQLLNTKKTRANNLQLMRGAELKNNNIYLTSSSYQSILLNLKICNFLINNTQAEEGGIIDKIMTNITTKIWKIPEVVTNDQFGAYVCMIDFQKIEEIQNKNYQLMEQNKIEKLRIDNLKRKYALNYNLANADSSYELIFGFLKECNKILQEIFKVQNLKKIEMQIQENTEELSVLRLKIQGSDETFFIKNIFDAVFLHLIFAMFEFLFILDNSNYV